MWNTIWLIQPNTPVDEIRDEFFAVFGDGIDVPESGIMPASHQGAGMYFVHCLLPMSMEDAITLKNDAGHAGWAVRGWQSVSATHPIYNTDDPPVIIGYEAEVIVPVAVEVLAVQNDRWNYDAEGNPTIKRDPELNWLSQYAGQAPWKDEVNV